MQIISSPEHLRHDPPFEILDGERVPYFEMPRRVAIITAALAEAGFPAPRAPGGYGLDPILAVHRADYVDYLGRAYAGWVAAGRPEAALLPCTFPRAGFAGPSRSPAAEAARYCFDLSAPIVAGTYAAARSAADAALGGAALIQAGERAAYALCRPPGHHAMPAMAGGYCYLNNAAIAAHALAAGAMIGAGESRDDPAASPDRPAYWNLGAPVVAVLDIDFHHGNGTQAIFYERSDVLVVSIHADPEREYPYFAGFADERGAHGGEGYTLNLPLGAGVDDAGYLAALTQALDTIAAYGPRYLVVSAGLDTFAGDPLGDFQLTTPGYRRIGAQIAQLGLPTLFVQEGGYAIDELGRNVAGLLGGFVEGR